MNVKITDDGQGIECVATPNHQLKADEPVNWTINDPTALNIAPDPNDASGLTVKGTLPTPPKDVTGLFFTVSCTRDSDGVVVTQDSPLFDIVPNPNNDVSGFSLQLQAL